jgi:chemotaxis response regulator CheB
MTTTTTASADRAYLAARDLLDATRAPEIFVSAADYAKERADRLISACEVLAFDACADERQEVREATQDLLDHTELLVRRIEAAQEIGGTADDVVALYAPSYEEAARIWLQAMAALVSASMR